MTWSHSKGRPLSYHLSSGGGAKTFGTSWQSTHGYPLHLKSQIWWRCQRIGVFGESCKKDRVIHPSETLTLIGQPTVLDKNSNFYWRHNETQNERKTRRLSLINTKNRRTCLRVTQPSSFPVFNSRRRRGGFVTNICQWFTPGCSYTPRDK